MESIHKEARAYAKEFIGSSDGYEAYAEFEDIAEAYIDASVKQDEITRKVMTEQAWHFIWEMMVAAHVDGNTIAEKHREFEHAMKNVKTMEE